MLTWISRLPSLGIQYARRTYRLLLYNYFLVLHYKSPLLSYCRKYSKPPIAAATTIGTPSKIAFEAFFEGVGAALLPNPCMRCLPVTVGFGFRGGNSVGSVIPSTRACNRQRYSSATSLSYLSRTLVSASTGTPCSCKYVRQRSFPPNLIYCSCWSVQASIWTDRTKEMCVPRPRCLPLQSVQNKIPSFGDPQFGLTAPQSAHTLFPGMLSSSA
jgi:hypothetical protein